MALWERRGGGRGGSLHFTVLFAGLGMLLGDLAIRHTGTESMQWEVSGMRETVTLNLLCCALLCRHAKYALLCLHLQIALPSGTPVRPPSLHLPANRARHPVDPASSHNRFLQRGVRGALRVVVCVVVFGREDKLGEECEALRAWVGFEGAVGDGGDVRGVVLGVVLVRG
jgi:hypothetical protein